MTRALSLAAGRQGRIIHLGLAPVVGLGLAFSIATGNWVGVGIAIGAPLFILLSIKKPFALLVLLLLGDPTILVFTDSLLASGVAINSARIIFGALVAVGLLRLLLRPGERVSLLPVEKLMILYAVVAGVSWFLHASGRPPEELRLDAAMFIKGVTMPFVLFMVARRLHWTKERIGLIFGGLSLVALYLGVTGFLQMQLGLDVFRRPGIPLIHPGRATGSFSNAVEYGAVLTVILFLAIFLMGQIKERSLQLLLVVASVSALAGVSLSLTRGVWLALGLGALYVAIKIGHARTVTPLLLGAGAVALFLVIQPQIGDSGVDERLSDSGTIYNRLALYSTAANMIAHNPVFGVGFGALSYDTNKADYYAPFGSVSAQFAAWPTVPHNQYLFVTVQTGIVGLILYGSIVFSIWRLMSRAYGRATDRASIGARLAVIVQGSFVVVLVHALVADVVFFSYLLLLLFFLAGVAIGVQENKADFRFSGEAAPPEH